MLIHIEPEALVTVIPDEDVSDILFGVFCKQRNTDIWIAILLEFHKVW